MPGVEVRRRVLAAKAQRADDGSIARRVLLDQIRKKAPALTHELEETASRMVVLGKAGEVPVQVPDPLRQERDLDLGRSGVAVLDGVGTDDLLLLLPRERHSILRHERWRDCIPCSSTGGGYQARLIPANARRMSGPERATSQPHRPLGDDLRLRAADHRFGAGTITGRGRKDQRSRPQGSPLAPDDHRSRPTITAPPPDPPAITACDLTG